MQSLINRFQGQEGQRRLRECLSHQTIIGTDDRLLDALLPVIKLRDLSAGTS